MPYCPPPKPVQENNLKKTFHQIVGFCRDDFSSLGVPQNQVGISAHSDASLPGVAVEDLGSVGTGHCYKIVLVHLPGDLGSSRGRGTMAGDVPCCQQPRPQGRTPLPPAEQGTRRSSSRSELHGHAAWGSTPRWGCNFGDKGDGGGGMAEPCPWGLNNTPEGFGFLGLCEI